MASKDLVKGYCKESKCEYDVYTKEGSDETFIPKNLETILDCNDTSLESGFYYCTGETLNTPYTSGWFLKIMKKKLSDETNRTMITQTIYRYRDNVIYERHYNDIDTPEEAVCEWKEWVRVVTEPEVVLKGDIAVLTGTIEMPEQNAEAIIGTATISYPAGFTMSNCVVISVMATRPDATSIGWSTPSFLSNAVSYMKGSIGLDARLDSSNILVSTYKPNTVAERHDVNFKLVLMKIS